MYMRPGLVVDPIEAGLNGQTGQQAVLGAVLVAGCYIHRPALVVERVWRVAPVLVPALNDSQPDIGPLIHHTNCKHAELLF